MHRNAVVEVHRIPHAAQRAHTLALDLAVIREHAAGRLGQRTHLLGDGFFKLSTLCVGVVGRRLAVLLGRSIRIDFTRRDVGDECRFVLLERNQHLLGQVDLGVVGLTIGRPSRCDRQLRVAQQIPRISGDRASRFSTRRLQHQLLECPDGLCRERAEDPIGRARIKTEVDQTLLQHFDVVAHQALLERPGHRRKRRLGVTHGWRHPDSGRRFGAHGQWSDRARSDLGVRRVGRRSAATADKPDAENQSDQADRDEDRGAVRHLRRFCRLMGRAGRAGW